MTFPIHRPRRLRRNEALRRLVRETRLTADGLIYPMFVCPGTKVRKEVGSMPGVHQQSADQIVEECREVESLGLSAVILFGLPESKDPRGQSSLTRKASSSAPSKPFAKPISIFWSLPTSACASTPTTATAA